MIAADDERLYERQLEPADEIDDDARAAEAFAERAWIPDISDEAADEADDFDDSDEVD